jgi:MFS transporter, ACDE family, multidrug resistance protein
LASSSLIGLGLGLIVRIFSSACIEIPLLAFMMSRIPRDRLGSFEPARIFFQAGCIALAPWLGFQLREYFHPLTPYVIGGIGGGLVVLVSLMALPGARKGAVSVAVMRRPAETIRHFFRQPRLRLAWLLALTRSSFWIVFYVYAPIFTVATGWSPSAGAAVLSLGAATLLLVPFWGFLARRFGIRGLLIAGYALSGLCLLLTAGAAFAMPALAPLFLLATALMMSTIDGAGNVPFLRATRAHERASMAGIYMTYRDVSQFLPLATFSLILAFSPLATAFALSAGFLFAAALLSQFVHPRLR